MFYLILQVLPVLLFSYAAQVFMKKGSAVIGDVSLNEFIAHPFRIIIPLLLNWQIILGFFFAGIGAIIYLFVLSRNEFGVVVPTIGALGFLMLPLISWFALNEAITFNRVIGTFIIVIGMVIVTRS